MKLAYFKEHLLPVLRTKIFERLEDGVPRTARDLTFEVIQAYNNNPIDYDDDLSIPDKAFAEMISLVTAQLRKLVTSGNVSTPYKEIPKYDQASTKLKKVNVYKFVSKAVAKTKRPNPESLIKDPQALLFYRSLGERTLKALQDNTWTAKPLASQVLTEIFIRAGLQQFTLTVPDQKVFNAAVAGYINEYYRFEAGAFVVFKDERLQPILSLLSIRILTFLAENPHSAFTSRDIAYHLVAKQLDDSYISKLSTFEVNSKDFIQLVRVVVKQLNMMRNEMIRLPSKYVSKTMYRDETPHRVRAYQSKPGTKYHDLVAKRGAYEVNEVEGSPLAVDLEVSSVREVTARKFTKQLCKNAPDVIENLLPLLDKAQLSKVKLLLDSEYKKRNREKNAVSNLVNILTGE